MMRSSYLLVSMAMTSTLRRRSFEADLLAGSVLIRFPTPVRLATLIVMKQFDHGSGSIGADARCCSASGRLRIAVRGSAVSVKTNTCCFRLPLELELLAASACLFATDRTVVPIGSGTLRGSDVIIG